MSKVVASWQTVRRLALALAILAIAAAVLTIMFTFGLPPLPPPPPDIEDLVQRIEAFQISDLMIALAAGILVPIWAILLARSVPRSTEMAA